MIDRDKWQSYSFYQQMGNIASELGRVILFESRQDLKHRDSALWRLLELVDLTVENPGNRNRRKELCRFKEVLADWYSGRNDYEVRPESLKNYAMQFALLTSKK